MESRGYRARIPLEERLSNLRSGLPANDGSCAGSLAAMYAMPVEKNFTGDPVELRNLKRLMEAAGPDCTFEELALTIACASRCASSWTTSQPTPRSRILTSSSP